MPHHGRDIEVMPTADGLWVAGRAGRARLSKIGPGVARVDVDGHAYAEFAEHLIATIDEQLGSCGHIFLGLDAEAMRSYDARFRYLWTEWIKRNRDSIIGIHMLFGSSLAESAAVVINAVTGEDKVETCNNREQFEDRLAAEVERELTCA
ncbi:hypothetical protein G6O69_34095 [Pseudenhygromyxa sp. WMMC2535]|uniref:hypothetical protein n=1 Tax=Pseudenhygromyxa sp. WMMC2535 TaxID=2712867 RepID=UPI00155235DE|nr:hypothetical protein [Pseudenhygromyxa sp. WMMC2535]NVB42903.1 hypothetical protein [Pseudenhygromyxa sp. WMMC2535]